MIKKWLSLMLPLVLFFSMLTPAFANVTKFDEKKVLDASLANENENKVRAKLLKDKKLNDVIEDVYAAAIDPGFGATRITTGGWTSGYTYQDDQESGIAQNIWNISLSIAGYFVRTAGNIILDIADLFGDTLFDKTKGATTRLYHSYYNPQKFGQVYTYNRVWSTYYTSENRAWYRHQYASYVNGNGITRTYTRDYTKDLGYSPIKTDYAPHYSDNTYLQQAAWERWYYNRSAGLEDWTGVRP